jgi:hypothetical protein
MAELLGRGGTFLGPTLLPQAQEGPLVARSVRHSAAYRLAEPTSFGRVHGRGLVQWKGLSEPKVLKPGDWVHVQPGVAHWHGATADSDFVHLAITASGVTEWGEPVTE